MILPRPVLYRDVLDLGTVEFMSHCLNDVLLATKEFYADQRVLNAAIAPEWNDD